MLTRIGIETQVDAVTASTFFKRRNAHEFSMYLAGWGAATGEMSSPLRALVATPDKAKGYGGTHRGRYSNPKMDALLDQALARVDADTGDARLQTAVQGVRHDYGVIQTHLKLTPRDYSTQLTSKNRTAIH